MPGWPHSFRAGSQELMENQTRHPRDLSRHRVQALLSSSATPNLARTAFYHLRSRGVTSV